MKNLFRFAMAVAVLFTASCAKEDISSSIGGGEVEVTFTANLADLGTRADDKTIGLGKHINVVYLGVYEHNNPTNHLASLTSDEDGNLKAYPVANGEAKISVVLLKNKKYDLVFWAQKDGLTTNAGNPVYKMNWKARQLNVDYGDLANIEERDAFFDVRNGFLAGGNPEEHPTTFYLKRPFAQLNAGLSNTEVTNVTNNGVVVKDIMSNAKVTNVATTLNLGQNNAGTVEYTGEYVELAMNVKPTESLYIGTQKYNYVSLNYLLVNDKDLVTVEYEFKENGVEDTIYERKYSNVPVQRNYRTNIVGNLLSSEYDFNVIIVPGFLGDNDTTVEYPEEGKLENLITPNLSKKSAQIILQSDVTWTTGAGIGSTPLIPEGAALKDLTIQGGEVSRAGEQPKITFKGAGVGAVRAANGGTITFRNVTIVDESESYAENSWEYGYLELGGKLVFEDCTFVNAMMFEGTEATFTNCRFNSNKDSEYALWVSDGKVTVSESTIEGPRGIKVHEAYGSEVASVAIDKCTFILTQKPALAIGDVNADTAISIKNSEISAQPGDQGLYIYETDTDVNTFDFVLENNKVAKVVTTDEDLAAALKANVETMTIILKNDLNVKSGHNNLFGGEKTKTLTIMGLRGTETLNFDTNYMPTMNCAGKMIVKNLKISRVAPSANTWDVRDLMLCSDIEMKNVTLEKGVAVCGDINCKFTDVTFAESGDYYALWIEAAGANVELNNCTVTSAGRGIKIDEQYVGAEEKALVNLSVAGTTFNTKNKAAVVVKSAAGADIVWGEGNDISKVAADKVNAVWVDEDAADYYDLVEVTGCTKMLEGALDSIIEDLKSGEDVTLTSNVTGSASDGGYSKAGIVINGQTVDGAGHTLTVNDANSTWDCAVYHTGGTLKNITVAGAFRGVFTAGANSDIIIDNVIFKDVIYTFNSDGVNKNNYGVYISNSTLNGWTSHSDIHKEVVYTDCSFGEGCGYKFCRPYGPTTFVRCNFCEGYKIDPQTEILLVDCKLNGVAITDANISDIATDPSKVKFAPVVNTTDALKNALTTETYVKVAAGEYTFPASSIKAGATIECAEDTVFKGASSLDIKGATVIGATFSNPTGNAVGSTINGTFKNCTFTGSNALRYTYAGETVVFDNCVFSGSTYGIHFDGGANDVIFRNCTISGFNGLGAELTLVTFENCTFVGNGKSGYNGANLWGSAKLVNCEFTFNGTTANEWIDCIGADKTYEFENCTINGVDYTAENYKSYDNIFSRNNVTVKINGADCAM